MDRNKSQAYNYAYEVIPVMFHSQTSDFITYLQRDGLEFLEFWWNYIGDQLPEEQHCPFDGMSYDFFEMDDKNKVAIITLPEPHDNGEVYYLILIAKPEKRFAWVRLPSTRVVALVRQNTLDEPEGTEIGDITPRGLYVRIRTGPAPTMENIKKIVNVLLNPQPQ